MAESPRLAEFPALVWRPGLESWNRFAAVNGEYVDLHMSAEAARANGLPDVFGMGSLRTQYQLLLLEAWLGRRGKVRRYSCRFRAPNFPGDVLTAWARVADMTPSSARLEMGIRNQGGAETTPATADVDWCVVKPQLPSDETVLPPQTGLRGVLPGILLDEPTLAWVGREAAGATSWPVDANDLRRWRLAVAHGADRGVPVPVRAADEVAPLGFNPFAWHPDYRPEAYPWMRGVGREPGTRPLNGGTVMEFGAPILVGDAVTCRPRLIGASEKTGRLGPMLVLVDEEVWTNQREEVVRRTRRTTLYY